MKKKRTRKVPEYLKKRCRAARVSLRTPKTNKPRKPETLRRMCKKQKQTNTKTNLKRSNVKRSNDAREFARYRTQSQAEIAALKKERDMVTAQLEEQMKAAGVTDQATMDRLHAVEEELAKATNDFQDCAKTNEAIQQRLIQSVGQYEECTEQLQRIRDEMQDIEDLRADLEQELKSTRAQLKDCRKAHKGRDTGDKILRSKSNDDVKLRADLQNEVDNLKSDIKECRRAHKDRSITTDQKQQIENLRSDLEQELKSTRAQLKDCRKAHKGRDTGDKILRSKSNDDVKLRADLEKRVDDLEGQIKECRRAHKDRSGEDKEIQRQLNILDGTVKQLRKQLGESVHREATCKTAYDKRGVLLEKRKATMAKMREKYHTDTQNIIARHKKHKALNEQCRTDLGECRTSAAKLKESALADYNSKVDDWKRCDMENRKLVKQLKIEKAKGRELSAKAQLRENDLRTELEHLRIQGEIGDMLMQEPSGPSKQGGGRTPEDVRRAEIIAKEAQGSLVMGFGNYDLPLFNKFFD